MTKHLTERQIDILREEGRERKRKGERERDIQRYYCYYIFKINEE